MTVYAAAPPRASIVLPYRLSAAAACWISPLCLLALWWVASARGWCPPEILVPPAQVWATFLDLLQSGELADNLGISLVRLAFGFGIGAGLGIVFGVAAALFPSVDAYFSPTFNAIRQVPSIAFIPVLILLFGIGETFKILVVVKATFFPVALAALRGVRAIPTGTLEVGRIYRLSRLQQVTRVAIPAALPSVMTGLRLGLGRSWGVLVAAELIASEVGLGQMMQLARQTFRLDVVMVGVAVAGAIGFLLDFSFRRLEQRLARWRITP